MFVSKNTFSVSWWTYGANSSRNSNESVPAFIYRVEDDRNDGTEHPCYANRNPSTVTLGSVYGLGEKERKRNHNDKYHKL